MNLMKKILINTKYLKGIIKRSKIVGLKTTTQEVLIYKKKYIDLIKKNGFKPDFKFKIMLVANYSKIVSLIPDLDFNFISDVVPTPISRFYLGMKTNPFDKKYKLVDKVLFYKILNENNVPIPQTYFYTKDDNYFDLEGNLVNDLSFYEDKEMFIKASGGSGGQDADIIIFNPKKRYKNGLIFQEMVKSHDAIKKIAPVKAVQTLRVNTYLTKDGEIEYDSQFIKLPPKHAISDNSFTGSIMVAMDPDTGKLKKHGITKDGDKLEGKYITHHYNSNIEFENYQIPYWNEVKSVIKKLYSFYPDLRSIGWDIAITNSGPVILEGNSVGNIFFEQLICGPFFYKKMIQENLD